MKKPHIDTPSFYKKKQKAQVLNTSFHRYKIRIARILRRCIFR